MAEEINPKIALTIAVNQNRIRAEIRTLEIQRSEAIKRINVKIKELKQELRDADEAWTTGAFQQDFDFMEEQ